MTDRSVSYLTLSVIVVVGLMITGVALTIWNWAEINRQATLLAQLSAVEAAVAAQTASALAIATATSGGGGVRISATIDTDCRFNITNTCELGVAVIADDSGCNVTYCEDSRFLPAGTACTSGCFKDVLDGELTCSGGGVCGSNVTSDCKGVCAIPDDATDPWVLNSTDCDDAINIYPKFSLRSNGNYVTFGSVDHLFLSYRGTDCYYGACVRVGIRWEIGALGPGNWMNPNTIQFSCMDYVDVDTTSIECVRVKAYEIEPNITFGLHFMTGYGEPHAMYGQMCVFSYACAPYNTTLYNDSRFLTKRAIEGGDGDEEVETQEPEAAYVRSTAEAIVTEHQETLRAFFERAAKRP